MRETSKSMFRRINDIRFATRFFVGDGIDIGSGPDPLGLYAEFFPGIRSLASWDKSNGDAQFMEGVDDNSLNFVHSSHCLEHLGDPRVAIGNWFRILKPGGHLIVSVPDEDLYEQGAMSEGHNWSFTIHKHTTWSQCSVNVFELLAGLGPAAQVLKVELLDATYRFRLPKLDQTLTPVGESAIEFFVRKRPAEEVAVGGRLPPKVSLSPVERYLLTGQKPE